MFEQRINEAVTEWELGAIGKEGKLPSKEDVDQYRSFLHQRFAPQEAAIEPMQIAPSQEISGIDLGQGLPRQQFIDAAFAPAPANVEPPYKDKPAPALQELKPLREVVLMQRTDFVPAVTSRFQGTATQPEAGMSSRLSDLIVAEQMWQTERDWFTLRPQPTPPGQPPAPCIITRTQYQDLHGQ